MKCCPFKLATELLRDDAARMPCRFTTFEMADRAALIMVLLSVGWFVIQLLVCVCVQCWSGEILNLSHKAGGVIFGAPATARLTLGRFGSALLSLKNPNVE